MRTVIGVAVATATTAVVLCLATMPLAVAGLAGASSGAAPLGGSGNEPTGATPGPLVGGPPSSLALSDIPPLMLSLYESAAVRCPGLPWEVLAAIGKVETDHGRGSLVSPAGAEGPMQFMPATWSRYGVDADGDGDPDIWEAADAVPAAADLLCDNGGGNPSTLASAVFDYNHSAAYIQTVMDWAARYAG